MNLLRQHAEHQYADELAALAKADSKTRPPNWKLSPWAVATYLLGGKLEDGTVITPKYIGDRRVIEIAISTLATDRALLLLGVPGTAKTWVAEHLAAAISGDSTLLVQGTAGTSEESLRYGWNYAELLAKGPSIKALVASPMMQAMKAGQIARVEELTRIPADVQDTLITILSEKTLPIPELGEEVQAAKGFNVIATANSRDRGVNEFEQRAETPLQHGRPAPAGQPRGGGADCPAARRAAWAARWNCPPNRRPSRKSAAWSPSSGNCAAASPATVRPNSNRRARTLSTAEAIGVMNQGLSLAAHFGDGTLRAADMAGGLVGAVVKDPVQDRVVWQEYLETVVKERDGWKDFYRACKKAE